MVKRLFALSALLVAVLFAAPALAADCRALTAQALDGARVVSADVTPAGPMTTPVPLAEPMTQNLPAFCRVRGIAAGSIGFEVWLPVEGWNGRLLSVGSAGFGGDQPLSALAAGLSRGYAVTGNDTGHQGADPSWMKDPGKVRLWGHTATHLVTAPVKALVAGYYGAPARRAYFEGCSTGGAQAMAEAQFYPDDYDGIVAGAPGMSYAHLMMSFLWGLKATEPPGALIPPEKLPVLHAAVLADCDGDDGLKDGLITDPEACRFDPASIICAPSDIVAAACLTPAQARTAQLIYSGPRNRRTGAAIYPGFAYGSEADGSAGKPLAYGWGAIQGPLAQVFAIPLLRTMVYRDPAWDWRTFDWDRDVAEVDRRVGADITALSPHLERFRARGGKLLIHQGWGDQFNGQTLPIEYRRQVIAAMAAKGRPAGAEQTVDGFLRVFMAPGMGHCAGGPGFSTFDALGAVQAWVETGRAPDQILGYRRAGAALGAGGARPICAYPKSARYTGAGSPTDPASFRCVVSKGGLQGGRS
ncbi:MAG: tannase/feruloyl esterase family alpha/beta hydrolase [Phenylobacterium sp.]